MSAARRAAKAAEADDINRKLKIQLGTCKRMLKEVAAYEKEVIDNEAKVQKMRDDEKDPYDIRKQEEVLQESYMMVPDSKTRMERTMEDLQGLVDECSEAAEGEVDSTLLEEAKALLAAQEE